VLKPFKSMRHTFKIASSADRYVTFS
jgi:hypothetical protein